jgi:hypothetical protein
VTAKLQTPRTPLSERKLLGIRLRASLRPLVARGRTLQGQFVMLAVILFLSSLGMMLVVSQQLQVTHDQLNTIAIKGVSSVDVAQRLLQYVQDVDARAADYLANATLTETHPCTIIGPDPAHNLTAQTPLTYHDCDALNIDAELTLANKELDGAIRNVAYPGERTALNRIAAGLNEYRTHIMISRYEYEMAGTNFAPDNVHLINAKNAYYTAANVINVKISEQSILDANDEKSTDIPPCTLNVRTPKAIKVLTLSAQEWSKGSLEQNVACLTSIDKQHLDDAYNQAVEHLGLSLLILSITSILFWLLLIYTILRVTLLTHYVINFTLVLVTLASIIFSVLVIANFAGLYGQHGAFEIMVKDKYDSVYYSALIQEYGTAANADEARWLIAATFNDRDQIVRWQEDWEFNKATVISLILLVQENSARSEQDKALTDMLLVQENSTRLEQDKALTDMQRHWKNYTDIDPQIRAKAGNIYLPLYERIKNAQTLRLDRSNNEFSAFSNAVDKLASVNRADLNSTYDKANGFLTNYVPVCFVLFSLVGILASGSVLRRTRDF